MKRILLSYLLTIGTIVLAQKEFKCGQNFANDYLFSIDKTAKKRFDELIKSANESSQNSNLFKTTSNSYTIPVVFHILHLGGQENISDAQVNNAVAILNRDFRKQNADTTNIITQFKSLAADCNIEFRLATLDENGVCTNGITHHYTTATDWTNNFSNYIYTWDHTKYLNVYVVRTMQNGAAGYTYLPGVAPAPQDAIVILHDYVGSIGTSNTFTSRALTHEVGHWFNLQHVWGSTNQPGVACGDDGVSDTPITKGHYNCSLGSAVCTSGVVENVQNYMEYAYCSNMYTQGQKTRMQNCISIGTAGRNNLSTTMNLIATGVINPNNTCAPKAEFISTAVSCIGNSVNFTDYSYNAPITNWLWSSPLASNTSSSQNGTLNFTNSGLASIKLKVSNTFGADSITKQTLVVLPGLNSGTINLTQGFETTFPDNNWIATLPQYGSGFISNTTTAATGSNCVWVNNFYDTPNGPVSFYTPMYNLQSVSAPILSFKYAYAQQNAGNDDMLRVSVSINCGATWTQLYSDTGSLLNTTSTYYTNAYVSPYSGEWKTEALSLAGYTGNQEVAFKFEFTPSTSSPGNNIFIDDINISNSVNTKEIKSEIMNFSVFPNPIKDVLTIKLENSVLSNNMDDKLTFQVLNGLGQILLEENGTTKSSVINLSNFSNGIYFLKVSSIQGVYKTIKIIKE